MTVLTGRAANFIRITEAQYQSDIAAAEERGRASVNKVASPSTPNPPKSAEQLKAEESAMAEIKAQKAAQASRDAEAAKAEEEKKDPKVLARKINEHIASERAKGRTIGYAQAAAEIA